MTWDEVKSFALQYQPYLSTNWPEYVSEMKGVAEGAGVTYADILALNVRTEIAFGAFSDGCTALVWKGSEKMILGQNWDWNTELVTSSTSSNVSRTGLTRCQKDKQRISYV
jgi:isopenicillin-N N-acyltransferase-like protein